MMGLGFYMSHTKKEGLVLVCVVPGICVVLIIMLIVELIIVGFVRDAIRVASLLNWSCEAQYAGNSEAIDNCNTIVTGIDLM